MRNNNAYRLVKVKVGVFLHDMNWKNNRLISLIGIRIDKILMIPKPKSSSLFLLFSTHVRCV